MNDLSSFGAWLKRRRKALDLTQDDFAARIGVAIGTVRKWESNERRPSRAVVESLAQVLAIPHADRPAFFKVARAERAADHLPTAPASDGGLRAFCTPAHRLPPPRTSFVGRGRERVTLCSLLRRPDVRLVTLTGVGGSGKTRLALQVAADLQADYADGVVFVDLAPIGDPDLVAPAIANALGIRPIVGLPTPERLAADLQPRELLLVLDNFEQVATAGTLVAQLLGAAYRLRVLVTSRELLHLSGEHHLPVAPLAVPPEDVGAATGLQEFDAVRLFVERAQAVKPDFRLNDANAGAVAAICRHLDGLPLALELAASRIRLLSPQALLARLAQRLPLLTGGARDLPARQQTLRATIAWSYDLLTPREQHLFVRLAVFVGGWTVEAAEAVCRLAGEDAAVLEGLQVLLDKNLIRELPGAAGEVRLGMLESMREFAWEQLAAAGELAALRMRHACYFLQLAEQFELELHAPTFRSWMTRMALEHDNLRAALHTVMEAGDPELRLRLVSALWQFWIVHGPVMEGRMWMERVLAASTGEPSVTRAMVLVRAGDLAWLQARYTQAQALAEQGLAVWEALGGHAAPIPRRAGHVVPFGSRARALMVLGGIAAHQNDLPGAARYFEACLQAFEEAGDRVGANWACHEVARVAILRGDAARARPLVEASLARSHEIGEPTAVGDAYLLRGRLALAEGDYVHATQLFEAALGLFAVTESKLWVCEARILLGQVAVVQQAVERARAHLRAAIAIQRQEGIDIFVHPTLIGVAALASAAGDQQQAARLRGAAERLPGSGARLWVPAIYADTFVAMGTDDGSALAAAWAEGRAMTVEQAIAYALATDTTAD